MPQWTRMGALKITDPKSWKKEIEEAMTASDGRVGDAAKTLNVSERQLFRWLGLDELKNVKRAEFGLPKNGKRGRRTGATVNCSICGKADHNKRTCPKAKKK